MTTTSPARTRSSSSARVTRSVPCRVGADPPEDLVHLGEARPGQVAERGDEPADLLTGRPVVDPGPLPTGLDEAALAHHTQVSGGRRELEAAR